MFDLRYLFVSLDVRPGGGRRSRSGRPVPGWLAQRLACSVLLVGPGRPFELPSRAAAAARDGDMVRIDAGTYRGDAAVWKANNLTIVGVEGRTVIDNTGRAIANRKASWVIAGANTRVSNVAFVGAHDAAGRDANWAGIRQEGAGLIVSRCMFRGNDNGLLAGANGDSDITVSASEFAENGSGDGLSHNIYVGAVRSFTLQFSSSRDARIGHLVKSRALRNDIYHNSLRDGPAGGASYEIDLPNGGASYIVGNVIEQGPRGRNPTMLSYAEEGASNPIQALYVINNTFVNRPGRGTFVAIAGTPKESRLFNNIFAFGGTPLAGPGVQVTNLATRDPGFVDEKTGDYRLAAGSPAVDAGTDPGTGGGVKLKPLYQYAKLGGEPRPEHGALDIGAFER